MSTVQSILAAVFSAGVLALAGSLVDRWARVKGWKYPGGSPGVAVGLGLGFLTAFGLVRGRPDLPPVDVTDWIPFCACVVTVFGLIEAFVDLPWWARWTGRLLIAGGVVAVLLAPIRQSWELSSVVAVGIGVAVEILVAWAALESCAAEWRGVSVPALLAVVGVALAGVLGLSANSLVLDALSATVAAALVATTVAVVKVPRSTVARGGVSVAVVLLASLAVIAAIYADAPPLSPILVGLVPVAMAAGRIIPARGFWRRVPLGAAALIAVLLIAGAMWSAYGVFVETRAQAEYQF